MRAMMFDAPHAPLRLDQTARIPRPGAREVLIRVQACGVCRTDLHILDGELAEPKLPLVPGHEIVGTVVATGPGVERIREGDRVGVPWLGWTCGSCAYCLSGRENLCVRARFTGYQIDGGYAEYTVANERFCFAIPPLFTDVEAAPLLCAGLIGYRALRLAGDAPRLGLYGFRRRLTSPSGSSASRPAEGLRSRSLGTCRSRDFARAGGHLGGGLRRPAARATRCRAHLRTGWRAGPSGTRRHSQRRHSGLRWHPYERHPELPLPDSLGGAHGAFGR
jgi:propanol-preferring alcohol dehydrogenase